MPLLRVPPWAIIGLLLAAPFAVEAQPPRGKVYRIGHLSSGSPPGAAHIMEAYRQRLRELGYVVGQNLIIEYRWAEGKFERLPALAADLVRLNVDLITTGVDPAPQAAKNATRTIPIVAIGMSDPVGQALVASLGRPGGNLTGLTYEVVPDQAGKELELLRDAVPTVSRVAVLWNPDAGAWTDFYWKALRAAASTLGVTLQSVEVRGRGDLEGGFSTMVKARADAIVVLGDAVTFTHLAQITAFATRHRLPTMFDYREAVDAGGLMSYAVSLTDLWRRAAVYVDKILRGARPADLPVEQPTKLELVVNLKTAKAIGLTIPQSILVRADELIQ